MKKEAWFLAIAILIVLTACAELGITKPLTFNEQLATGYAGVTAVVNTTTTLLAEKKLAAADAANIEKQADNVKEALDLASTYEAVSTATGGAKLTAALAALAALQQYLATMGSAT